MSDTIKILIVDDEFAFAQIGELILTREGYQVSCCESGKKALTKIEEDCPDLVLSDVEMPEMDGFELLRVLRSHQKYKELPFILMSSRRSLPQDRIEGLNLGSDDYLTKPFSGSELLAHVQAVLRRSGKQQKENPSTPPPPPPKKEKTSTIYELIEHRIQENFPFTVLYADVKQLRYYNQRYGFEKGDKIIAYLEKLFKQSIQSISLGQDAVKHFGADDFIILSTPEKADQIAKTVIFNFDKNIGKFYDEKDRSQGFIQIKDRLKKSHSYPLLSIIIASVSNVNRKITHIGEVAQIGSELIAFGKSLGGSRLVTDRRKE